MVVIVIGVELSPLSSTLTNAWWLNIIGLCMLDMNNVVSTNGVWQFDTDSLLSDKFQYFERAKAFCPKFLRRLCFINGVGEVALIEPYEIVDFL